MKKALYFFSFLVLTIALACERPKSPDFKLNHQVQAPLTVEKTYTFLGTDGALIDTTQEDFENIFTSNEEGLVRITKQEQFNFGDLNDAIPEVDVAPTTVNTVVGELELNSFSASGNVGSASFQDVTGFSSPQQGQTIPAGSSPGAVNIDITTEFFQSAVIKEDGSLELTMTNQLGFDIDELEIVLNSGSSFVGQATIGTEGDATDNFDHASQRTAVIQIPASTQLSDMNVDISASWDEQQMEEEGDRLIVNDVRGQNLVASQFTGAPESQTFDNTGTSTVDQSNFEFRTADDYVELGGGDLTINITNNIDLGVDTLNLVFSDIVDPAGDPLQIPMANIPASSEGGNFSTTVDLTDYRIKAENGEINYTIDAKTENVQQGFDSSTDSYRTIAETDNLDAEVTLNNLVIGRAEGYTVPKRILLNEDATADGKLDAFNSDEAEVTSIDGLSDISNRISGLTFANPILSTIYETNLGVNTMVYAVIAGTNANGETIYLSGKPGSEYEVQSVPDELQIKGVKASANQVIKFAIDTAETPQASQGELGENVFNSATTNSSEFFSNLPTKIRFVGVAEVNENQHSGVIVNPVIFDPDLSVELPFDFSADNATFRDTLEADLKDLPGKGEDQKLSEATLTISYTNALPLDLDLTLKMLDANGNVVSSKEGIAIEPATTNASGFVEEGGAVQNKAQITFTESELSDLNKTRNIELHATINTPKKQDGTPKEVKLRETDSITIRVNMDVNITSTVN